MLLVLVLFVLLLVLVLLCVLLSHADAHSSPPFRCADLQPGHFRRCASKGTYGSVLLLFT